MLDTAVNEYVSRGFSERTLTVQRLTADSAGVEQKNCKNVPTTKPLESMFPIGRVGWPRKGQPCATLVLKYPIWQEAYRAAVTETNPKLLKHKIRAQSKPPYCDSNN